MVWRFFESEALESQRRANRKPSEPEQFLGPESRRNCVTLLPRTAPTVTVDVKVENIVVREVDGGDVRLSSSAKVAYSVRVAKRALKPGCLVYHVAFHGLLEAADQTSNGKFCREKYFQLLSEFLLRLKKWY